MMTDGVGRRLATLRVQGLVRKSNGRRQRQRYQCRVVGSKPLSSIRKSLEAAVVYPVSNPATRRDRPPVPSRRSRASVDERPQSAPKEAFVPNAKSRLRPIATFHPHTPEKHGVSSELSGGCPFGADREG
jgi:hypothetical protein